MNKILTASLRWLTVLLMLLSVPVPALAQSNFPFNEIQQLTPEQVKIQKYKLQRLRIQLLRDEWYIIRGINERIDDLTLLKMTDRTAKIKDEQSRQLIANYVMIGGLAVAGIGGLMLSDILKFQNSPLIGIGLVVVGGASALGAELWVGNLGEETTHLMERPDAEALAKEYNTKLKLELGLENVPNLD